MICTELCVNVVFKKVEGEWFACSVKDVKAAYIAVKNRTQNIENRNHDFMPCVLNRKKRL